MSPEPEHRHWWLWLTVAVTLVFLGVDWFLPDYLPFRSFYLLGVAAATWWGGRRWGSVLAAVSVVDLAFHEYPLLGEGGTVWSVVTRILLYATVITIATFGRRTYFQLSEAARTDPLTGLANRRQFDTVAGQEIERASRYYHPLSIAVLDVNAFKAFNDTNGHVAGDNALRRIGLELVRNLRSTDTVARIGGDEFAVILPETTEADAQVALQHVLGKIVQLYPAGVSVGVHEYSVHVPTVDSLLASSDKVMYEFKHRR